MKKSISEVRSLEAKKSFSNRLFRFGLALIGFELLSGLWLTYEKGLTARAMTFVLAHTFFGYLLIISLVMLFRRHLIYRRAWPSRRYDFLALGSMLTLCLGVITGAWIHWSGYAGAKWIWWTHFLSTLLHILFLALYIFQTVKMGLVETNKNLKKKFLLQVFRISIDIIAICLLFLGLLEVVRLAYGTPLASKTVVNYGLTLQEEKIFFPSKLKTTSGGFYQESYFTNSQSCGAIGCHSETVRQWQDSTHYRTPGPFVHRVEQLLIEEGKTKKLFAQLPSSHFEIIRNANPGREIFRTCAGCHAPVALLSGSVDKKEPFEIFEKFEGVSCKTCHSMKENITAMQGSGNFEVSAPNKLFFEDWASPVGKHLYHTLIRTRPEDHKSMFMKPGYKNAKICSSCHFTNQFESWDKGPFHDLQNETNTKSCQSCHMPQVKTDQDISASSKGTIADHRYLSAGFSMAQYFGLTEQYEKSKKFIQDKKMKIRILSQKIMHKNNSLQFVVRVSNIGVGHFFPSGPEADLVEAWIQIDILGKNNELLYKFGELDRENYLDSKKNKIWRVKNMDSHGRFLENDRHRSWRFSKDILDLIPPKEFSDIKFRVPSQNTINQEEVRIRARLMYRRPNQAFADWALGKGKFLVPAIEVATDEKDIHLSNENDLISLSENEYKADLNQIEVGFNKVKNIPATSIRTVVEDSLIIENALILSKWGRTDEALILLKNVSPAFLQNDSSMRRKYRSILQNIEKKQKNDSTHQEFAPGY